MKRHSRRLAVARGTPAAPVILKGRKSLHIGFLPENDCAPIVVAHEFGLFKEQGLDVQIHCEGSWKQLHDKIIYRQLDAAAAPAALPFLINLGLTPEKARCTTGLVLSLDGNGITLNRRLWSLGVRDAASLREEIRRRGRAGTYTFGVGCVFSAQYFLLCQWLRSAGIVPHVEVRIEAIPPVQMFPLLKLGYLDGYCAGEPWTSVAVQAGVGVCVASSRSLSPLHPEKVLMVREDFANDRADEHERLVAALLSACRYCEDPERNSLCELLAQPQFVNAPAECLQPGLCGPFERQAAGAAAPRALNIFHGGRANEPTAARADWITSRLYSFLRWRARPGGLKQVFRRDIFRRASRLLEPDLDPAAATLPPEEPGLLLASSHNRRWVE